MPSTPIIFYGPAGLQSQILAAYFKNLGYAFQRVNSQGALLSCVFEEPNSVVIIAFPDSPRALISLARQVASGGSGAYPHIFILHEGERFDTELEAVTLITGRFKLEQLARQIRP